MIPLKHYLFKFLLLFCTAINLSSAYANALKNSFNDPKLTVIIYDADNGQSHVYNSERASIRYTALSTFKIPNSIIALETNTANLTQVFKFNPARHKHPHRKGRNYNQDQTLASAFKISALWTYQEIAKQVGEKNYKNYLKKFNYGNQDTSGKIDQFWLESLKISAKEQVAFLKHLYLNKFNLKQKNIDALKKIMLLNEGGNYKLYGKTGTQLPEKQNWLGWIVGFIETKKKLFFYAINLESPSYQALKIKRSEALINSFKQLGISLSYKGK